MVTDELNISLDNGSDFDISLSDDVLSLSLEGGGSSGTDNYNDLRNKPSINNVVLVGNKTLQDLGISEILYNTTEYWNSQVGVQSEAGVLYVYSDYREEDGVYIPAVKIGDGNAYIIDLPFADDIYAKHVVNKTIHFTEEEKAFWNDKVTCFIDPLNDKKIIFTKD
jgi:hypothetical protein